MSISLCHSEGSESQRDKHQGMDYKKREEFLGLRIQMRPAVTALNTQAEELYEMAGKLEELTKDTTIRYTGLRVSVEARAGQLLTTACRRRSNVWQILYASVH
jgi:hypothetical protein